MYEDETNKVAEKVKNIVDKEGLDMNNIMKKIEAIDTKVKFKCFGKTNPSVRKHFNIRKCGHACQQTPCDNCKSQQQKDEETHERQAQKNRISYRKNQG